ncbi:Cadherin-like beta sandwich domain protein [Mucilaginibacter gotjawali]|uniref:Cadherin-like beta sandwich domain protein n=1 Tax=Mucilaginibacter gotjawali TaxID=1550579 RepID=A0A125T214_9SPHI|nr:Cadherin-like beta sandwich domain protein [Mucilaginibacter gotjawali]
MVLILGFKDANANAIPLLRSAGSTTLKSIKLSTGSTLTLISGTSNVNYTASVAAAVTILTVTPTTTTPASTVTVNGLPVASGTPSQAIAITTNPTVINLLVTASGGSTRSYSITIYKNGSSDAALKSIKLSTNSSLTQVTGTSNVNYTASVASSTASLTVTPTTDDPNATVTVNGIAVVSGSPSPSIALPANPTVINMLVTAQDGTVRSYAVTIYKNGSSDALLKSLKLSTGSLLTLVTGTSNANYTASVTSTTTSLMVTPTTDDPNATVTVNGIAVASGTASAPIAIPTNPTVINLLVTAQDGSTKRTISITVNKNGSSNAALKGLKLSTGSALTLVTGSSNVNYSASVSSSVAALTVTPTTADANATVTVNGIAVTSGTPSQSIALTSNPTVINLLVTGQDGSTTRTYSISVYQTSSLTFIWTGAGANSNWSNSSNWAPSTGFPAAGDTVLIGATAKTPVVDVPSACAAIQITGPTNVSLAAPLTVSGGVTVNAALSVSGTGGAFTADSLVINFNAGLTNSGTFTVNSGHIFLNVSASVTNNASGTFNAVNLQYINMVYQANIINSGNFNVRGSAIKLGGAGYISNMAGATFTINGASTIDFASNSAALAYIRNSGTFYAGSIGSACIVNLNYPGVYLQNTGTFYLGSSSVINLTGFGTSVQNTGNFTLQSDNTGCAAIGNISGVNAVCTGTYNVERYLSGGTSAYRSYRDLSSPVYEATVGGNNVYSVNYVKLSALITGTAGPAGGFDKAGNPTLYLYRDNLAPSNSSFTGGNFRGIANISADPNYTIDNDGSGFNIPVGNGFMFFDRGDRINNLANKYSPGTVAEAITLTATGTLNTGPVTVKPWFSLLSTLDYTAVAGNSSVLGLAFVGNPYPSSIDWDTFSTTSSASGIYGPNVSPFIYVLDPLSGSYNVYQQGNGGFGTLASSGSNVIPSGQGFFVSALSSAASLTFNEAGKTGAQANRAIGNLFLGNAPLANVSQFINLKLVQDSTHSDGLLVRFDSNAKPQFAMNEDAVYKPGSGAVSLSSLSADNVALAINSQALPKLSPAIIPLNVNATADGGYQLKLSAIKSIPDLYDVWLKDAYTKDSLDIKHNPAYAFDIVKSDTNSFGAKRFSLVVRENPALMVHLLNFAATKAVDGAQLVWKTENEQNYTNFTVEKSTDGGTTFNVLGGYASSAAGAYSLVDKAPAAGENLYRLKMVDLNGTASYSGVAKLMYSNTNSLAKSNISIYPNPSSGVINLAVNQDNSNSIPGISALQHLSLTPALNGVVNQQAYDIKIINAIGSVIKSVTSASATWQDNVSNLLPGTYVIEVINDKNKSLVGKSTFVKI